MIEGTLNILQGASPDIFITIGILVAILIYSYTKGKDHGVTMLVALYASSFPFFFVPGIFALLPGVQVDDWIRNLIVFITFFLLVFWILLHNEFFESPLVPSKWEIGVFAILFTGLFLSTVGQFLPEEIIMNFSDITDILFFADAMLLFWSAMPIGFWILIKGDY